MIKKIIILLNIFFLLYYSAQLLLFTDEFALKNLGDFNHAIAGLSEILGILLLSLSCGLLFILIKNYKNQLPIFIIIFLFEFLVTLNLWRYIITNSPGETNIEVILFNAILFSIASLSLIFVFKK